MLEIIRENSNSIESHLNNSDFEFLIESPNVINPNRISCTSNVSTQVSFNNILEDSFTFYGKNVQTQASIPPTLLNHNKPTTVDKSCGTDLMESNFYFSKISFHGFNSISSENTLKDLVILHLRCLLFFNLFLPENIRLLISKENTLLICLMKLKLGLTYLALSGFFSECLLLLSQRCRNVIFCPSKNTVQEILPGVFKKHYPCCKCIIDCNDLRTGTFQNSGKKSVHVFSL